MAKIQIAGADPALANFGIARMTLDLHDLSLQLNSLDLTTTEKMTGKVVRQNSDDLRRAVELTAAFQKGVEGCAVCFAEIPSGSQHSRSALGFGIAIGVLAGSPVPIIEVMPLETKLATVGKKTASKQEMIDWAVSQYPDGDWIKSRGKITQANEHLADACAIVHAGIRTPEFTRLLSLWKANPAAG